MSDPLHLPAELPSMRSSCLHTCRRLALESIPRGSHNSFVSTLTHIQDVSRADIRWIWAGPNPATGDTTYTGSTLSGTCTVAKVVGRAFGSAKRASITLVRLTDRNKRSTLENYIDSLVRIYDNIRMKGQRNRAVVLMTWLLEIDQDPSPYRKAVINAFTVLVRELTEFDVVFVTSPGDQGPVSKISTLYTYSDYL